jgi:hypothetical protein
MPIKRKDVNNDNDDNVSVASSNGSSRVSINTKRLRNTTTTTTKKPKFEPHIEQINHLYDIISSFKKNNRLLSDSFQRLPGRRTNAAYFQAIKNPIDLTAIQQRINNNFYKTLQDFADDMVLMFNNAKTFYGPVS